jgi:hypothetical protein
MQYMTVSAENCGIGKNAFSLQSFTSAVSRCSLIHNVYEVIAEGGEYSELCNAANLNEGFRDMYKGAENENDTWAVRVRHFGDEAGRKERRYGARTRTMTFEKEALTALKPLLLKFGGGVDLKDPDCKIYVMDGLGAEEKKKVLARKIASGRKVRCYFYNQGTRRFLARLEYVLKLILFFITGIFHSTFITSLCHDNTSRTHSCVFLMQHSRYPQRAKHT